MILALNVGNTQTAFSLFEKEEDRPPLLCLPTVERETPLGLASRLRQALLVTGVGSTIQDAVISSVVPAQTTVAVEAARLLCQKDPLVIGAGVKTGLRLAIDDPGTVASDLVCTAVAAKEEYPLPAVIVSLGTATTVTLVDDKAQFLGGAILPGVGISEEALIQKAALLYHVDLVPPRRCIGASTADCVRSGLIYGAAGAIDALIDRIEKELGAPAASVIVTGRLAGVVAPHLAHPVQADETLLLRGLAHLYFKNRPFRA